MSWIRMLSPEYGHTTVTWSRVTPFDVAPPLSPDQYGTQGGDCGSSICLGGSPTHLRTRETSIGVGAPPPPGPAAHGPLPMQSPVPGPVPLELDWSDGASVMLSTACGANSA